MMKSMPLIFLMIIFLSGFAQTQAAEQKYPDIIDATFTSSNGSYRFNVTVSSPYDSAKRYADAYRIMSESGEVFGIRELAHDHAYEQPFTRSVSGVKIPDDVRTLIIEGRDQQYGWGGKTFTIELP